MQKKVLEARDYIINKIGDFLPELAIVLGSGLGKVAECIENKISIPYNEIPNFPYSSVTGHKGVLSFGVINGKNVVVMEGRIHYYEWGKMHEVVFPIYVLNELGVKKIIFTNAVGAVHNDYKINDFALISDHINLTGYNPLIGKHYDYINNRFPSLYQLYSPKIIDLVENIANKKGIITHRCVYAQMSGSSFETSAEIKCLNIIGADVVGMSTAIEAISAKHCGMEVGCISLISNYACGINEANPSQEEVIENGAKVKDNYIYLLTELIKNL